MFARLTTAVTVAALAIAAYAQGPVTINTPTNVVVCQPVLLSWSGGTPPYFLSILPGNQPSAPPLVDFGRVDTTTRSWTANLGVGTSIFFQVRDSVGQLGQTAAVSILSSADTSCVGRDVTTSAGGANPPATTASTSAPAASSASTKASAGASSTSSPASTPSSGASKLTTGGLAIAGVAAVAALL